MKRKLLAILLAAAMIFVMLPVGVAAADVAATLNGTSYPTIAAAIAAVPADGAATITLANATYEDEVHIQLPKGKNITIDASAATFNNVVKVTVDQIAGNKAQLSDARTGSYVLTGFKVNDAMNIGARSVESLVINNCAIEAMYMNVSNCDVTLEGNTFTFGDVEKYKRYDGALNNKNCLQVYADNFDLNLIGNTMIGNPAYGSHLISIYGEAGWHNDISGIKNQIAMTGNTFDAEGKKVFHIYGTINYGKNIAGSDYITEEIAALSTQLLNENEIINPIEEVFSFQTNFVAGPGVVVNPIVDETLKEIFEDSQYYEDNFPSPLNFFMYFFMKKLFTEYVVAVEIEGNGTVAASDEDMLVRYNKDITFTAVPDEGSELTSILLDGEALTISADNTYTLENIKKAHTITFTFSEIEQEPAV